MNSTQTVVLDRSSLYSLPARFDWLLGAQSSLPKKILNFYKPIDFGAAVTVNKNFTHNGTDYNSFDSTQDALLDKLQYLAINELREYKLLPQGWDGYYAKKFDKNLIDFCIAFIEYAFPMFLEKNIIPNELTPGPVSDGSIDIEMLFDNDSVIFSFNPDYESFSVYIESQGIETRSVFNVENVIKEVKRTINTIKK